MFVVQSSLSLGTVREGYIRKKRKFLLWIFVLYKVNLLPPLYQIVVRLYRLNFEPN